MLVSVALIMIILSVVKLEKHKITPRTSILLKIGLTLIILAWVLLAMWTVLSLRSRSVEKLAPGYLDGTRVCSIVLWFDSILPPSRYSFLTLRYCLAPLSSPSFQTTGTK